MIKNGHDFNCITIRDKKNRLTASNSTGSSLFSAQAGAKEKKNRDDKSVTRVRNKRKDESVM